MKIFPHRGNSSTRFCSINTNNVCSTSKITLYPSKSYAQPMKYKLYITYEKTKN